MNMKRNLVLLFLISACSFLTVSATPNHRHHANLAGQVVTADSLSQGIEAFSDTTSAALDEAEDTADPASSAFDIFDDDAGFDDALSFESLSDDIFSGWGLAFCALVLLFVLIILLIPVIIIILVLRLIIRNHNDSVDRRQAARFSSQEQDYSRQPSEGQQIPEENLPIDRDDDDYMWRKGIRNSALGIGLMALFYFLGAQGLVGLGILVLCCGLGQLVISRTSSPHKN